MIDRLLHNCKHWRVAALAATIALGASTAAAQLIEKSDAPIDITGDTAELEGNIAIWTGNVRVVQGEGVLTTDKLIATLNDNNDFKTIEVMGAVRYSNGEEAITGEKGLYDAETRTITITENVLLTQGKQVMTAGKVVYFVDTGRVEFTPAPGGRIRGVFFTNSNDEEADNQS